MKLDTTRSTKSDCRLCRIGRGASKESFDTIVAETADYFAVPSLGAMVPGWLLICLKSHATNMLDAYNDPQFHSFRLRLVEVLLHQFKNPVRIFEHGPTHSGSEVGCGVDHAHTHLVPLPEPLAFGVDDINKQWTYIPLSQAASIAGTSEYLFFADDAAEIDPSGYLRKLSTPKSQFFRRIIAKQRQLSEFDYRDNQHLENIAATSQVFASNVFASV